MWKRPLRFFNGNLYAACGLFQYPDDTQVGWTSFYYCVRKFGLYLQLDKSRDKVAYKALEAVILASKENLRVALALLDCFGKHFGLKGELLLYQR